MLPKVVIHLRFAILTDIRKYDIVHKIKKHKHKFTFLFFFCELLYELFTIATIITSHAL